MKKGKICCVPSVWPSLSVEEEIIDEGLDNCLWQLLKESSALMGIVNDITYESVQTLEGLFEQNPQLNSRLIVFVYPACRSNKRVLTEIMRLQDALAPRVKFKLSHSTTGASNCLCFTIDDKPHFLIGSQSVFDQASSEPSECSFIFRDNSLLINKWVDWFDYLWPKAFPLNEFTVDIPHLVPAGGSKEASNIWCQYIEKCYDQPSVLVRSQETGTKVTPDLNKGQIVVVSDSIQNKKPSEELSIKAAEPMIERLSQLYEIGVQVQFNKLSRIRPLDAPMKPAWFGVESLRKVGSISRKVGYRISVIDETVLKDLENKKSAGRRILNQMSYSLGDGQRWMPERVMPLFEAELERINQQAQHRLTELLRGNVDAYVKSHRVRVTKDANAQYEEFNPGQTLPSEIIDEILNDLKNRLSEATKGSFMPNLNYSKISFSMQSESKWNSQWGQPLVFLSSVAQYPRKALTDRFFLQGVKVDHKELLKFMNICDDYIFEISQWDLHDIAKAELNLIDKIESLDSDEYDKCWLLVYLMEGKTLKWVVAGEALLSESKDYDFWAKNMIESFGSDLNDRLEAMYDLCNDS